MVSKVVQQICNGVPFDESSPLAPLNPLVASHHGAMKAFLESALVLDASVPALPAEHPEWRDAARSLWFRLPVYADDLLAALGMPPVDAPQSDAFNVGGPNPLLRFLTRFSVTRRPALFVEPGQNAAEGASPGKSDAATIRVPFMQLKGPLPPDEAAANRQLTSSQTEMVEAVTVLVEKRMCWGAFCVCVCVSQCSFARIVLLHARVCHCRIARNILQQRLQSGLHLCQIRPLLPNRN